MDPLITSINQATGYGSFPAISPTPTGTGTAYVAPAPAPAPTPDTTGTGGTGTTSTAPAYTSAQQSILDNIAKQKLAVTSAAGDQANASANDLLNGQYGILNTIANLKLGQRNVDQEGVQANLAKTQGLQGVLQMISHGIQSGGVTLANSNASNSSAAEALARAYGIQGRTAASQVGNQFAQAQNKMGQDQEAQDIASEEGVRQLNTFKSDAVNSIVQNATQQLNYLNSLAANASLPSQVDIEAQKQQIRDQALAALSQYDAQIANAKPTAMGQSDIAAKAAELATAGTAAAAPYDYTSVTPPQLQGSGPFASELPIFTYPGKRQTA